MRKRFLTFFGLVIGFVTICRPTLAHHGTAPYDEMNPITLKGVVTEFFWANPHSQVKFDIKDEKGNAVHWIAETFNPAKLVREGWTKNIVNPGDEVTIYLSPAKDGTHLGLLRKITLPDGRQLGPEAH